MQVDNAEGYVAKILEEIQSGCVMTKFILIAEAINQEGERGAYYVKNEGSMLWDEIGMLEFALAHAKARLNSFYIIEGEDDDDE